MRKRDGKKTWKGRKGGEGRGRGETRRIRRKSKGQEGGEIHISNPKDMDILENKWRGEEGWPRRR